MVGKRRSAMVREVVSARANGTGAGSLFRPAAGPSTIQSYAENLCLTPSNSESTTQSFLERLPVF